MGLILAADQPNVATIVGHQPDSSRPIVGHRQAFEFPGLLLIEAIDIRMGIRPSASQLVPKTISSSALAGCVEIVGDRERGDK